MKYLLVTICNDSLIKMIRIKFQSFFNKLMIFFGILAATYDRKIFYSIISFNSVDMMNLFKRFKRSTKIFFHDQSMQIKIPLFMRNPRYNITPRCNGGSTLPRVSLTKHRFSNLFSMLFIKFDSFRPSPHGDSPFSKILAHYSIKSITILVSCALLVISLSGCGGLYAFIQCGDGGYCFEGRKYGCRGSDKCLAIEKSKCLKDGKTWNEEYGFCEHEPVVIREMR
jgi:hypothetical protein